MTTTVKIHYVNTDPLVCRTKHIPYGTLSYWGTPQEIDDLRAQGLVCIGPYHNDMWYIFYSKEDSRILRQAEWRRVYNRNG